MSVRRNPLQRFVILAVALTCTASGLATQREDGNDNGSAQTVPIGFVTENAAAMNRMMAAMHVTSSGDVDADFVAMMIPHHQGAIDMAVAELRYGKNAQLRRIAQEIIIEQQQEIAAMRLALGQALPPSTPAPTQVTPARHAPAPAPPGSSP